MDSCGLPFDIGQEVEIRSFIQGYRGAWFKCKIKEIRRRNEELWYALKYIDFPGQKITWTKVYQKRRRSKDGERTLMVRPSFPSIRHENQMADVHVISEVVVIVNDVWELGDLVDWWTDGCNWSGKITEKLGDEKVKIELLPPPMGEGSSYEVFCKDLRPSLDWSISEGWKLCIAKESKYHISSARIVRPLNHVESQNLIDSTVSKVEKGAQPTGGPPIDHKSSVSSNMSAGQLCLPDKTEQLVKKSSTRKQTNTTGKIIGSDIVDYGSKRTSCSDSLSGQYVQDARAQMGGSSFQTDKYDDYGCSKKMKIDQNICLNSTSSDTTEAAVLDLEELISRIKWLNNILEFGIPLSNTKACWKFVEHRAP